MLAVYLGHSSQTAVRRGSAAGGATQTASTAPRAPHPRKRDTTPHVRLHPQRAPHTTMATSPEKPAAAFPDSVTSVSPT